MDEQSIIDLLLAPPNAAETVDEAFDRKERILGSVFGRLSAVESRGMWLRISRERAGDGLSEAFARFPRARRERLMSLLQDERRIAAVARRIAGQ